VPCMGDTRTSRSVVDSHHSFVTFNVATCRWSWARLRDGSTKLVTNVIRGASKVVSIDLSAFTHSQTVQAHTPHRGRHRDQEFASLQPARFAVCTMAAS
jgi:hypothetical protein